MTTLPLNFFTTTFCFSRQPRDLIISIGIITEMLFLPALVNFRTFLSFSFIFFMVPTAVGTAVRTNCYIFILTLYGFLDNLKGSVLIQQRAFFNRRFASVLFIDALCYFSRRFFLFFGIFYGLVQP